jgi:hypothetical protein
MPNPKWKCETCAYWYDLNEDNRGQCRRSPPRLQEFKTGSLWPETQGGSDWCGEWRSRVEKKSKNERDLRQLETCLISIGNKATYVRWFEHTHDLTAVKENGKVIKEGMSQKTFDRRLKDLKDYGRVTVNGEGKGATYSWVRPSEEEGISTVAHEGIAVSPRQTAASISELTGLVNDEPK